jgi:hypothetical protein
MRLVFYELKKLLIVEKGILILILCPLCMFLLFFLFPEQKDIRIKASDKQFRLYLEQFYGEDTEEKQRLIREEYTAVTECLGKFADMLTAYQKGELSEEEWMVYSREYERADLKSNAIRIFMETADRFSLINAEKRPWYIYEYSGNTVFTLLGFPDIFLCFGLLFLASKCYTYEADHQILPLLLSMKKGGRILFFTKLLAVLFTGTVTALVGVGLEYLAFYLRGFLHDLNVPIYSISFFSEAAASDLTLKNALLFCFGMRLFGAVTLSIIVFLLSVCIRRGVMLFLFGAVWVLTFFMFGAILGFSWGYLLEAGLNAPSRFLILCEGDRSGFLSITLLIRAVIMAVLLCINARKRINPAYFAK